MKISMKTAGVAALAGTAALAATGLLRSRLTTRSAQRRPAPGRIIKVGGVDLHVLQQGSGPDVLLIHGAAMVASEIMLALGDALPGHRITAIDRPGHGWSDARRCPSIHNQAELFHGAAVQLGLSKPVVVGHSLGGAVALAYGDRFAGETAGVVAVAPLAYPGWGLAHIGRALRGAPVLGALLSNTTLAVADPEAMRLGVRLAFSPQKPTPTFQDTIDNDVLAQPSAMVADGADFTRASLDLQRLSRGYLNYPVPVHVVVGEKDRVLKPSRQGERLARTVSDAGLTPVAGAGHMVHHFAPEAVAAAVAEVRARSAAVQEFALAA